MRPDQVPGAILGDILETLATGQVTGFVWVILVVGIGAAVHWLWRAIRDRWF